MRKLYGYSSESEFPDRDSWMDCTLPEDRSYVENSCFAAVKDYTAQTLYDATYRARQKNGAIRCLLLLSVFCVAFWPDTGYS